MGCHGRGAGFGLTIWWALAVAGPACATNAATPDPGDRLVLDSGDRIAVPRTLLTAAGVTRTVRYELETTREIVEDAGTTPLASVGCIWITFFERVVRVSDDRELELEIEVVDGSDPSCEEGRRFTVTAPVPPAPAEQTASWRTKLGPVELAHRLHARLGTPNGTFAFSARALPWTGTVAAARAQGVDYVAYRARERHEEKLEDTQIEDSWDATMRLRPRGRRLACAAGLQRSRQTQNGKDVMRVSVREAIVVDHGDGVPPRCEDSPPVRPGPSRPSILERVTQLAAIAKQAARGELGCGEGPFTLMTSRGPVRIVTGLDPIHVFGDAIATADLVVLLEARIASNRSGAPGPMSGSVGRLGALAVSLLAHSKEPEAIPLGAALLTDPDDNIRDAATTALYELGDTRPRWRPQIRAIRFPPERRGKSVPAWLRE